MEIERCVGKALEAPSEALSTVIDEAREVLKHENKLREGSGLIYMAPEAVKRVVVIGDIHGDLESLIHIFKDNDVETADRIIFLGDYGDRGEKSVEVYYLLLRLKAWLREKLILLRGNHEGPPDMLAMPHDLPLFFTIKYGAKGRELYDRLKGLWQYLPYVVLIAGRYLMVHGGVSAKITSINDIAHAHEIHPLFEEILWNDPIEGKGYFSSPRGAGMMFGEDITDVVFNALGVKTLIRSHEPCDGIEVRQRGRILTLFSRKGAPYFNKQAAYLVLDETMLQDAMDAKELVRNAARIW